MLFQVVQLCELEGIQALLLCHWSVPTRQISAVPEASTMTALVPLAMSWMTQW